MLRFALARVHSRLPDSPVPRSLSRLTLLVSAAGASLVLRAAPAHAQIGFEDLLGSITDVDVSITCWSTRSESLRDANCPRRHVGYGIEVLWALKTIPVGRQPHVDTTWVPSGKSVQAHGSRADTTTTLKPQVEAPKRPGYHVLVELGLGYSQFSGFGSSNARFDLRGTVREQPSVAFYASAEGPGLLDHVNPYLGLRSGLVKLTGVQAFVPPQGDSTTAFTGTAEVFQVGLAAGVAFGSDEASLFVEGQLNLRRFGSVDWTGGNGGTIPGFLPRSLDFTGPSVSIGAQIHVRDAP